jgi:hypothetical protein
MTTQTLTVLGKRKAHVATMRLVGSEPEHSDHEKPILINGKLSVPTKRRYKCTHDGCDKAYTKPSRLEEHERTHTGEVCVEEASCEVLHLISRQEAIRLRNMLQGVSQGITSTRSC